MRSVLLAAIHNGELQNAPAQRVVDQLASEEFTQEFIEIREQPALVERVDQAELWNWRRGQRRLESRWRNYIDRRRTDREVAASLNLVAYRFRLRVSKKFREKQWRQRQIEKFVTAKHIHSWRQFLDSKANTLIVLESDAAETPDLVTHLDAALSQMAEKIPVYVNLAGGISQSDLGIEKFIDTRMNGMTVFSRPVTNTSCAYAINRRMAELMIHFLEDHPETGELGIDWLFNAFFLEETSKGESVNCLHADPPILIHGSLHGITSSWHPDR